MPLWLTSIFSRIGITGAIIAGLLLLNLAQAVNTYADIRILLPFGLHIGFTGWKPHALASDETIKQMKAASDANAVAQKKVNDDQKAKFNSSAEKTNAAYPKTLADNRSAAAHYRDTHRVSAPDSSVSTTPAAPQSDAARLPETTPAATGVYVSDADYDACVTDYSYAKAAFDWSQDLLAKGTAEFKGP